MVVSAADGQEAVPFLQQGDCGGGQRLFGRQEQLAADPYLETREKEDAFLQRIESTICNALRFAPVPMAAVQPSTPMHTEPAPADDDLSMALDFADSF